MKTQILKRAILALLMAVTVVTASAYKFESNGIYYNVLNSDPFTYRGNLEVTYKDKNYNSYSGSVTIPSYFHYDGYNYEVRKIGDDAFRDCDNLTSVTIGNHVREIGERAFQNCTGLTSVTINPVHKIGGAAFSGCTGLTSVTISSSVTEIGWSAFYGCTGLTSVTIPNSVTSIGSSAFSGCTGLKSVTIPNSVTEIGSGAFSKCSSLTSVTIPNSVFEIGPSTFNECTGLKSVTIGNSVTTIRDWAFLGCTGLTSVKIPNSVTHIHDYAFEGCTGLKSVSIGNSVKCIAFGVFSECDNITTFTSYAEDPPYNEYGIGSFTTSCTLYVPAESIERYRSRPHWSSFKNIEAINNGAGIEDIVVDDDNADCPIEVFNLSGVKVGNSTEDLTPGIYIVKRGGSVSKCVIQ